MRWNAARALEPIRLAMNIPEQLWWWIRGDLTTEAFEKWLYAQTSDLEGSLGRSTYFELIECDYRDPSATGSLRRRLSLQLPRSCVCPLMLDRQRMPMTLESAGSGSFFRSKFEILRTAPNGMRLWSCRNCGTRWCVATDDDASDAWYLERVLPARAEEILAGGAWPATFEEFGERWPGGQLRWSSSPQAATFQLGCVFEMTLDEDAKLVFRT